MSKPTTQRPPQVTFTAALIMAGSVFVVLGNFARVSTLRSLESLESIRETITQAPFDQLDLTVEQGLSMLHWTLMIGAVSAAVCGIFGWFVMQGSSQARWVLTGVAVPMFLAGMFTGSFTSAMLTAAVAMLWMPPAREWIRDGEWTPPEVPEKGAAVTRELSHNSPNPPTVQPHIGQPGTPGADGQPAPWTQSFGAPGSNPYGQAPGGAAQQPGAPRGPRPPALVIAGLVTMLFSGAVALLCSVMVFMTLTDFEFLLKPLREESPELFDQPGVTEELLRNTVLFMGGAMVVWSLVAFALAVATLAGINWARIALLVSSVTCAGFCLMGVFVQPATLLPVIGAVLVLFMLRRPEVRRWMKGAS